MIDTIRLKQCGLGIVIALCTIKASETAAETIRFKEYISIHGTEVGENFGCYLANGRMDWDGDDHDDLLVSVPGNEDDPALLGFVAIYSGSTMTAKALNGQSTFLSNDSATTLFRRSGASHLDEFGDAVVLLSDLDGDGNREIAITAPDANRDTNGQNPKGGVFVIQGGDKGKDASGQYLNKQRAYPDPALSGELQKIEAGAKIGPDGAVSEIGKIRFGLTSHYAIAAGSPCTNKVYIFGFLYSKLGSSTFWEEGSNGVRFKHILTLNGTTVYDPEDALQGIGANPDFGRSVAGIGDVTGDGFGELVVGAPDACKAGTSSCTDEPFQGAVLAFGGTFAPGQSNVISLWANWGEFGPDADTGSMVLRRPQYGFAVAKAGKWKLGSGTTDAVIVGAYNSQNDTVHPQQSNGATGRIYVYQASTGDILFKWHPQYYYHKVNTYTYFAYSVAGGFDLGADGFGDVVIGSPYHQQTPTGQGPDLSTVGRVWVVAGNGGPAPVAEDDCVVCSDPKMASCPICNGNCRQCLSGENVYCPDVDVYLDVSGKLEEQDGPMFSENHPRYSCQTGANGQGEPETIFPNASRGLGYRVAIIGDINGDGHMDIAASSPAIDLPDVSTGMDKGLVRIYASYRLGDVNDDGIVDISDVSYLNSYLTNPQGHCPPMPFCEAGDVNHDGTLTVADRDALLDFSFNGLCAYLPCQWIPTCSATLPDIGVTDIDGAAPRDICQPSECQ